MAEIEEKIHETQNMVAEDIRSRKYEVYENYMVAKGKRKKGGKGKGKKKGKR